MKQYIFHYNGDCVDVDESEFLEPGEMSYHEHLIQEDGKICQIGNWIDTAACGKPCTEAYFEDGNELIVFMEELEAVEC